MKQITENYRIRGARFEAAPTAITTVVGLRLLMEVWPSTRTGPEACDLNDIHYPMN